MGPRSDVMKFDHCGEHSMSADKLPITPILIPETGALATVDYDFCDDSADYDYDYECELEYAFACFDALSDCGLMQIECGYFSVATKFDSAASSNMSGLKTRLKNVDWNLSSGVMIKAYNGTRNKAGAIGENSDGLREYHVPGMPDDLVLLCAQMYVAKHGAAVLFEEDGEVLDLNETELREFRAYVHKLKSAKKLKVVNRTYEVVEDEHALSASVEEAHSSTATRYFNTKVNVSNNEQRVLTMLLTGLSFADLYSMVTNKSVGGLPPDLTKTALNRFAHKYGRTPDIVRLANPINYKSLFGLMESDWIVRVGQRVECDEMHPDLNVTVNKKTVKVKTFGGAESALVFVDVYSGFVKGKLMKAGVPFRDEILYLIKKMKLDNKKIEVLAADSGIVSQTKYDLLCTEAEDLLMNHGVKFERVEPLNHSRGGAVVEVTIRLIKQLIRTATVYVLTNPNFETFGFSKVDIFRMWGELFSWAIAIINLKPCPREPTKTRYEVYYGEKPNAQNIRILPIFSCVLVIRPAAKNVIGTGKDSEGTEYVYSTNQPRNELALYIGPSLKTVGGIRAIAKTSDDVMQVFVTSKFTAASDGGGLNVHKDVAAGADRLISEMNKAERVKELVSEPVIHEQPVAEKPVEETVVEVPEPSNDIDIEVAVGRDVVDQAEEAEKPVVEINEVKKTVEVIHKPTLPRPARRAIERKIMKKAKKIQAVASGAYGKPYLSTGQRRSERLQSKKEEGSSAEQVETACFADWRDFEDDSQVYWSFATNSFVEIIDREEAMHAEVGGDTSVEVAYRAVTQGVPRTFAQALKDPVWGDAARKEWNTLIETNAIVAVDKEFALKCLRGEASKADLVTLFPVYEEKIKEGQLVRKVRLVGDGRTHYHAGDTYAATPSREELLIMLHIIAALGWEYAHVDEIRAFLNSKYKGESDVYVKPQGDSEMYKVVGALYGLRTSPRDYQDEVATRLSSLGFKRLTMCKCMYILVESSKMIIIYDFVDDFIFTGNSREFIDMKILEMRSKTSTTEPIWNAERVLGLQIYRDWETRTISITMADKISELREKYDTGLDRAIATPMPTTGYVIKEEDFGKLAADRQVFLDSKGIHDYMAIVGSLIWISGIRIDVLFAVMYLTWFTKAPRVHHLRMALYCVEYLSQSKDMPLVLGGRSDFGVIAYTDASVGTATKGRSTYGHAVKMSEEAGAIYAKSGTTLSVHLSSFESELDGMTSAMKSVTRVRNILSELRLEFAAVSTVYSDNKAMLEFVKGNAVAKNVKHMELRMWYIRDNYARGNVEVKYMPGVEIPVDKLTKLGDKAGHKKFVYDLLGHGLLLN